MIYDITPEMESQSKFGISHKNSGIWFWAEIDRETKEYTGNKGTLHAIKEIEALDRLREAFPDIGAIKWINSKVYLYIMGYGQE